MKRLAVKIPLPQEAQQIANHLMDAEGTCTCGRIMTRLEARLVLMTAVPSRGELLAAAYCLMCAGNINKTLASLRSVIYVGDTETAKIELPNCFK